MRQLKYARVFDFQMICQKETRTRLKFALLKFLIHNIMFIFWLLKMFRPTVLTADPAFPLLVGFWS